MNNANSADIRVLCIMADRLLSHHAAVQALYKKVPDPAVTRWHIETLGGTITSLAAEITARATAVDQPTHRAWTVSALTNAIQSAAQATGALATVTQHLADVREREARRARTGELGAPEVTTEAFKTIDEQLHHAIDTLYAGHSDLRAWAFTVQEAVERTAAATARSQRVAPPTAPTAEPERPPSSSGPAQPNTGQRPSR